MVDGRVTYAGPSRPGADVQVLRGWVLPGLVDAHCHVGLDARGAVDESTTETQARTDRDAGTLLIRDAGSPADTRWVDGREELPRIIRAGRHLARPRRYQPGYAHEIEPAELTAYVRREARRGDGWVKLVGDWIDRDRGDLAPCWPREALTEAVAAAHEEGARVTAHCFGEESLRDFAAAGTDCIEHACGLDEETTAVFAAQGIAIVPTLVNLATFPAIAERARAKFPAYGDHLVDLHTRRYRTVGQAHDAGIPVFVGTDAGGSLPHGLVAQEVARADPGGSVPDRGDRGGDLGGPQLAAPARDRGGMPLPTWSSTTPTPGPTFAPLLIRGTSSCAGARVGAVTRPRRCRPASSKGQVLSLRGPNNRNN